MDIEDLMKKNNTRIACFILLILFIGAFLFRDKIGIAIRQYHFMQTIPKESRLRGPASKGPLDILPGEIYPTDSLMGDIESFETFSIYPNQDVHDNSVGYEISHSTVFQGIVSDEYFKNKKVTINLLDSNKKLLKSVHAKSISNMYNSGMNKFQGDIDFNDTELPNGSAFIEIKNRNDATRSILIPIVINN